MTTIQEQSIQLKKEFEDLINKNKELSDDELNNVNGGVNQAGNYMFSKGTRFRVLKDQSPTEIGIYEIVEQFIYEGRNAYYCDVYGIRNGVKTQVYQSRESYGENFFTTVLALGYFEIYNG